MAVGLGYFLKGVSEGLPSAQQLESFRYLRDERKRRTEEFITELETKQRQADLDAALQSAIQAGEPKEEVARRGFEAGEFTLAQLNEILYPEVEPTTHVLRLDPQTGEPMSVRADLVYGKEGEGRPKEKEPKPIIEKLGGKRYDVGTPEGEAAYQEVYEEAEKKKAAATLEKDIRAEADEIYKRMWGQESTIRSNYKIMGMTDKELSERIRTRTPDIIHQEALTEARRKLTPGTLYPRPVGPSVVERPIGGMTSIGGAGVSESQYDLSNPEIKKAADKYGVDSEQFRAFIEWYYAK